MSVMSKGLRVILPADLEWGVPEERGILLEDVLEMKDGNTVLVEVDGEYVDGEQVRADTGIRECEVTRITPEILNS